MSFELTLTRCVTRSAVPVLRRRRVRLAMARRMMHAVQFSDQGSGTALRGTSSVVLPCLHANLLSLACMALVLPRRHAGRQFALLVLVAMRAAAAKRSASSAARAAHVSRMLESAYWDAACVLRAPPHALCWSWKPEERRPATLRRCKPSSTVLLKCSAAQTCTVRKWTCGAWAASGRRCVSCPALPVMRRPSCGDVCPSLPATAAEPAAHRPFQASSLTKVNICNEFVPCHT